MASSDASWQKTISPGDPRYEYWLLLQAFMQSEDHAAKADFLKAFQANGKICLDDFLKYVERFFDAGAKALAITVNGSESAEIVARNLDEFVRRTVAQFQKWLHQIESPTGRSVASLETEMKLRLVTRVESWKAEAFRFGMESEISRAKKSTDATPGAPGVGQLVNHEKARRLGRPPISEEKKLAALEIKRKGGSNKDAAKALYNVTHPTPRQVKSTSTILREFKNKLNRASGRTTEESNK
jgi:hypothetical protein